MIIKWHHMNFRQLTSFANESIPSDSFVLFHSCSKATTQTSWGSKAFLITTLLS